MLKKIITISFFFISLLGLLLVSCKNNKSKIEQINNKNEKIARVYNNYLYHSDIKDVVAPNTTKNDSIEIINSFINNWIRKELLLHEATLQKDLDLKNIENKINEYRNSLIIYSFENKYLQQNLDTNITIKEIQDYYNDNSKDFILNEGLIKVNLLKISEKHRLLNLINKYVNSNKSEDRIALTELCYKNNLDLKLHNDKWSNINKIEDLINSTNINSNKKITINNNKKVYQVSDKNDRYYFFIDEYKNIGEYSPIELVQDKIATIIIKQRSAKLKESLSEDIFNNALNKNNYEIYR